MLTKLHQNSSTAGGIYEGLYQPCKDDIWFWVCQWRQLPELVLLKTRQTVSNHIIHTSNVDNTYIDAISRSTVVQ